MPPKRKPRNRIPSKFQKSQDAAWERATQTSIKETQIVQATSETSRKNLTKMATDWQQVWNEAKPSPFDLERIQDEARTIASTKQERSNEQKGEETKSTVDNKEAHEYDAAKPLVDFRRVWMQALVKNGLAEDPEGRISKGLETTKGKVTDSGSDADSESSQQLFHPSLSHASSLPSSPKFSKPSIVFSDRAPKQISKYHTTSSASSSSGKLMLKRCKPIVKKEASKALGMGESWYVVKDEDANEEWETLHGADVEDSWDLLPEVEKFRVEDEMKGFNQRMREFFEGEKVKREQERKAKL